ncbi:histidine utilization repressor [Alteromonas aestuariivivens]|uniref:Histidine utilization repressor n=1 Tax=Alteromonas aestuariivivens TaxID=1938339 RepID=A0A3D8M8B1_9ALTE|nr:histidine utilization repressor [Alteromonas aestuariivivens]RDV26054.1 histidine utilization repressor [Alteromonas aestuariivivens]
MQPRYMAIKSAILENIESGALAPGDQVESENQLAEQFSVSRMTARRALTELVDEGILARSQGLGTFVSDSRPMSSMLAIVGIQEEIRARGHRYDCVRVYQQCVVASDKHSRWLGVETGTQLFHTSIVHRENGVPVQLEDRLVNPQWAPEYLQQDFSVTTANEYLSIVAPLTEADHTIEAVLPSPEVAELLDIPATQPCLQIHRRTFSARGIVSVASLTHPGNRYRIGGHLNFSSGRKE